MLAIRLAKILMVAAIALFASLVTFGNLTDYGINFAFVQHVLSMDPIFHFPRSDTARSRVSRCITRLFRDHRDGSGDRVALLDRRRLARAPHPSRRAHINRAKRSPSLALRSASCSGR